MVIDLQISSLAELLNILPNCKPEDYSNIARYMDLQIEDFEPYMSWNSERYTRNCIAKTKQYELILLCWEAGQETSIHCHGGEECWVYSFKGQIEEKHYELKEEKPILTADYVMKANGISYMNDTLGYHQLKNVSPNRAITLHLYMDPIEECTAWDETTMTFVPVKLEYDTFKGRPILNEN